MIEGHLYLFPFVVCLLIPFAYFLSSLLAVHFDQSKLQWIFLSRTTSDGPESAVFSQLINFASFILIVTVYIRYRQIAELIRNNPTGGIKYAQLNSTFLFSGLLSAFGISVIANFSHLNVFVIEIFATYVTLIGSVATLFCETFLSFWIRPLLYRSRFLPILRMILTGLCTLALFVFLIFQTITLICFNNERKVWTPIDAGWIPHLIRTISLWLLSSSSLVFIGTWIVDFRRIKILSPKILLSTDMIDERTDDLLRISR